MFSSKREVLVRDARQLLGDGVDYKVSELPPSIRTPEELVQRETVPVLERSAPVRPSAPHSQTAHVMDIRKEV